MKALAGTLVGAFAISEPAMRTPFDEMTTPDSATVIGWACALVAVMVIALFLVEQVYAP